MMTLYVAYGKYLSPYMEANDLYTSVTNPKTMFIIKWVSNFHILEYFVLWNVHNKIVISNHVCP